MNIQLIYSHLSDIDLVVSQVHFSEAWLGRSKRYYSHLIATGGEPGLATLVALEWRLRNRAAMMQHPRDRLMLEWAAALRSHIETRGITDIRCRRAAS